MMGIACDGDGRQENSKVDYLMGGSLGDVVKERQRPAGIGATKLHHEWQQKSRRPRCRRADGTPRNSKGATLTHGSLGDHAYGCGGKQDVLQSGKAN